jgi:hypothetical protein
VFPALAYANLVSRVLRLKLDLVTHQPSLSCPIGLLDPPPASCLSSFRAGPTIVTPPPPSGLKASAGAIDVRGYSDLPSRGGRCSCVLEPLHAPQSGLAELGLAATMFRRTFRPCLRELIAGAVPADVKQCTD